MEARLEIAERNLQPGVCAREHKLPMKEVDLSATESKERLSVLCENLFYDSGTGFEK